MPCIWGQHNNSQLFCVVAVLPASAATVSAGTIYSGQVHACRALIDTGATTTCISKRLATILQLQPIGKVPVHGVAGIVHHNSYLFSIGFPFMLAPGVPPPPGIQAEPGTVTTQLHLLDKVLQGCEFDGGAAPRFDVLLGMDVISTGSLVVQGNATFSFSF
jgi:hypothetical protein